MNREESIAHFDKIEAVRKAALDEGKPQGDAHEAAKSTWNKWAEELLAERKAIESNGEWEAKKDFDTNYREVGLNHKTKSWLDRANLDLNTLHFVIKEKKNNIEAKDDENNSEDKPSDVNSIYSEGASINFSGYIFPAYANFNSTTFNGDTDFSSTTFSGYAYFRSTTFSEYAYFGFATFSGDASFRSAAFRGESDFRSTTFSDETSFRLTTFSGYTSFKSTTFGGYAYFGSATFSKYADFRSSTICGDADFRSATFSKYADFSSARFIRYADFSSTTFSGDADFRSAAFSGYAYFVSATFSSDAYFRSATFSGDATFAQAEFKSYANFSEAEFNSQMNFHAIESHVSFNLSHARFRHVPDLLNAKFRVEEPPNLDNVKVQRRPWWTLGYHNVETAAKFRKLKKLAIQAHYTKGELDFHAQELRAERFTYFKGWPIPKLLNFSFWFSLAYGTFSDFGRSVFRPLLTWSILLALFSGVYLLEHPELKSSLKSAQSPGTFSYVQDQALTTYDAWAAGHNCVPPISDQSQSTINALKKTNAPYESFYLSLKNALVFIDWDRSEAARRTFGCLYGFEKDGSNFVPIVPLSVSILNIVQNILSAILIFLFGLALRNMLKLK